VAWRQWESLIVERGIEIDRPRGSDQPRYPDWRYPLDYGFIPGTVGGDGKEVDVFCGSANNGLTAALLVRHDRQDDIKLLWNPTEDEIHVAHEFLVDDMPVTIIRRAGPAIWPG
jgi:inorganic pyrophosphatase